MAFFDLGSGFFVGRHHSSDIDHGLFCLRGLYHFDNLVLDLLHEGTPKVFYFPFFLSYYGDLFTTASRQVAGLRFLDIQRFRRLKFDGTFAANDLHGLG
jgi:hypothetical protein